MQNKKINHYKATLKNKELEKTISDFLTKLSEYKGVNVYIMLSGNIEDFIDGKIKKSNPLKIHFYNIQFDIDIDNNVAFHQFKK